MVWSRGLVSLRAVGVKAAPERAGCLWKLAGVGETPTVAGQADGEPVETRGTSVKEKNGL